MKLISKSTLSIHKIVENDLRNPVISKSNIFFIIFKIYNEIEKNFTPYFVQKLKLFFFFIIIPKQIDLKCKKKF